MLSLGVRPWGKMAIEEQPRENLMRDAVAYSTRILLPATGNEPPVFFGLRPDNGWSVYFGEVPVYQFNDRSQLRRAHVGNQRFAARDGKLFTLVREKAIGRVEMQWRYSPEVEQATLSQCHQLLKRLTTCLVSGESKTLAEFPESPNSSSTLASSALLEKLTSMPMPIVVALSCHVRK
jgi:hypothetical protein